MAASGTSVSQTTRWKSARLLKIELGMSFNGTTLHDGSKESPVPNLATLHGTSLTLTLTENRSVFYV